MPSQRCSRAGLRPEAYPILEFDPAREAVLEPSRVKTPMDVPEHAVVCFFQDVVTKLQGEHGARQVAELESEQSPHPVYELEVDGRRLVVFHPGVGAPLAAGLLEEVIALGCRKFVACGGAGAVDGRLETGRVVVPVSAVRDEGTSYHYMPPGREVEPSPEAVASIRETLDHRGIDYTAGKTWTTDAIYRETRDKVLARREEGCVVVAMEAAAFFAVAQFRGVTFGQLLYAGDDVSGEEWDHRGWNRSRMPVRERLFWLATEACLAL